MTRCCAVLAALPRNMFCYPWLAVDSNWRESKIFPSKWNLWGPEARSQAGQAEPSKKITSRLQALVQWAAQGVWVLAERKRALALRQEMQDSGSPRVGLLGPGGGVSNGSFRFGPERSHTCTTLHSLCLLSLCCEALC